MFENHFENELYEQVNDSLYALNFEKIKKGCQEKWFGSINFNYGNSPQTIYIDESEPLHFVQILFILKELSFDENRWMLFTKNGLMSMIKTSERGYLENEEFFGKKFVQEFNSQIEFFLERYCDIVGNY